MVENHHLRCIAAESAASAMAERLHAIIKAIARDWAHSPCLVAKVLPIPNENSPSHRQFGSQVKALCRASAAPRVCHFPALACPFGSGLVQVWRPRKLP